MNTVNMLADYTNHLSSQGMSAGTVKIYMGHLGRFGKWIEGTYGDFDPAATTALDVADYRRYLQNRNRKPATINNALNAISNFFTFARDTGLVDNDPSAGVKRVKEQKTAPKWLSRRDTGAFVRAVQKHGNKKEKALIMLLLHTGLRVSEAVSLNVADIVIRERSGHVIVRRGKGDKYREVPLNVTIRNALQNYISSLAGDVLFPGKYKDKHMTRQAVNVMFDKFSMLSGIKASPHRLRHTFCKSLIDAKEDLGRVAVLAGHESLNTTARYTQPGRDDLQAAVEKLAWE